MLPAHLNFSALEGAEELPDIREEWLKQRWGKFTASELHRLMANGKAKGSVGVGAETYAKEKAVELLTGFVMPDTFISTAMQWGLDHEAEAIQAFSERTAVDVYMTGGAQEFIASECGNWGGTPDGMTDDAGVEVKCPNSINHIEYMGIHDAESLLEIAPKYYWQVQGCMELARATEWWFISYDPRLESIGKHLHYTRISRVQQDIDRLKDRIEWAVKYRDEFIKKVTG